MQTIRENTESQKIDETVFNEFIKEIKNFWANHEKPVDKTIDEYRMERPEKKVWLF